MCARRMRLRRSSLSPAFSAGESRNQAYQTDAQPTPSRPNTKKEARHRYRLWMGTTKSCATAPPIWLAVSVTPDIVARCAGGNQRVTDGAASLWSRLSHHAPQGGIGSCLERQS